MTLPNFIVAGAPKAGTQSLYEYFRENPSVFMPPIKEVRFFCYGGSQNRYKYPVRNLAEYEDLFSNAASFPAIGEVSSFYFWHPDSAARIRATIPDVKLIFSLREPTQRQFSIYHMNLRSRGRNEGRGFIEAMQSDPHLQIKYFDCLKRYVDRFPKQNISFILFEDLSKKPVETMRRLYNFVGASDQHMPLPKVHNPGGVPKSKSFHRLINHDAFRAFARNYMPKAIVSKLKDVRSMNLSKDSMTMTDEERDFGYKFFREDILRTQELIDMDLSHWLKPDDRPTRMDDTTVR